MANASVTLIKEKMDVITVTAAAAAAQGDLLIIGPWVALALNDAAIGEDLSLLVEEGVEIDATSSVSGVASAVGDAIYYNPTTGAFAGSAASGYYKVGYTTVVKNASNVFRFEKSKYAISYAEATITLSDISDLASLTVTMSQVSDLSDLELNDLADVSLSSPADTEVLKYATSDSLWHNAADATA